MLTHVAVKPPDDHCRIGSLETRHAAPGVRPVDHCRIGSLEMSAALKKSGYFDHCRIGSLESRMERRTLTVDDHCRIGSLENQALPHRKGKGGSLPHRQLRKKHWNRMTVSRRSLPHRQLRNL